MTFSTGKLTAAKELLTLLKEELKQSKEEEKSIRTVIEAQTKQADALKLELTTANVCYGVVLLSVFTSDRKPKSPARRNSATPSASSLKYPMQSQRYKR